MVIKNKINIEKHHVSFEEAQTVFRDYNALIIPDIEHSENEERFLILGLSEKLKLLMVCHCYKESDHIRILSARKATRNEASQYNSGG